MSMSGVAPTVELAPTATPTTNPASATWVDITSRVRSIEVTQGRSAEHATTPPGTATITAVDPTGDLDPLYAGGAFAPLRLGALVRVRSGATNLFTGAVDDYGQDYSAGGIGNVEASLYAVDLQAALGAAPYAATLNAVIERLRPYRWCRFGDIVGGTWEDVGAKQQRVRTVLSVRGKAGGGPDGHGSAECDPGGGVGGYCAPVGLYGDMGSGDFTLLVAARPGWGVDVSTQNLPHVALPNWRLLWSMDDTAKRQLLVELNLQTNVHGIALGSTGGGWRHLAIATRPLWNAWHLLAFRRVTSGGNETFSAWLDGTKLGQVVTAGSPIAVEDSRTALGGMSGAPIELAHVALWQRGLTDTELVEAWRAMSGGTRELPGERIRRALDAAGVGSWASVASGQSLLGPVAEAQTAADVAQEAAQGDEGIFWVDGSGAPTFSGRSSRRRRTSPTAILGDGPGEVAYTAIDPRLDTKDLYTVASVNGQYAEDSTAVATYGRRASSAASRRNTLLPRDDKARAQGIVALQATPRLRVSRVQVRIPGDGTAAAVTWTPGTLLTLRRRPRAGQLIEQDAFVEGRTIKLDASGEGTVTLTLSAAPPAERTAAAWGAATFGGSDTWAY